jgi:hypothetical protein
MDKPDNRVVFGRGGTGKTSLVNQWLSDYRGRVLIFDPNAEPHYEVGAAVVTTQAEMLHLLLPAPKALRLCFRGVEPGDFERFNEVAWKAERALIVWEEVDSWFKNRDQSPWAFKIVNQGRHRDLTTMAVSRRPARVARDLTANAQRIACFGTREPRDVRYLEEFIGEAARALGDLPRFQAVDWTESRVGRLVTRKLPRKKRS